MRQAKVWKVEDEITAMELSDNKRSVEHEPKKQRNKLPKLLSLWK